jgi:large subunit ribosomal protein L29
VKAEQVREMSVDDLKSKVKELSEQMFRLRLQQSVGQLDNPMRIRETRKDIARVRTALRQKQQSSQAKA